MRKTIIGVMGPGEKARREDKEAAFELGQRIAQSGWVLLTGGRNRGVMDAASKGAQSAGGLVIGILPTKNTYFASSAVDIQIITGMGSARNYINILSSDVVIACGMGAGTASEVSLAIKEERPVILLNSSKEAQQFFQKLAPELISIVTTAEAAIEQARTWLS